MKKEPSNTPDPAKVDSILISDGITKRYKETTANNRISIAIPRGKIVGFVVAPMSDGQNLYNQQVASAFAQLLGYIENQNRLIEEYEGVLKALKDKQESAEE